MSTDTQNEQSTAHKAFELQKRVVEVKGVLSTLGTGAYIPFIDIYAKVKGIEVTQPMKLRIRQIMNLKPRPDEAHLLDLIEESLAVQVEAMEALKG